MIFLRLQSHIKSYQVSTNFKHFMVWGQLVSLLKLIMDRVVAFSLESYNHTQLFIDKFHSILY